MSQNDRRLLLLDERDNVVVAAANLARGEPIDLGGEVTALAADLALGHKLACRDIAMGEKVLKYGAPIGTATRAIGRGEHVHLHNLASDYTATHTRDLPPAEASRA